MNLAEILKRKLENKPEEKETKIETEDIPYQPVVAFSPPSEDLFLALYTPFLKNPYAFDWFIFREYSAYLLDGCYVLNTFNQMSKDSLMSLYLNKLNPSTYEEYAKIVHFVGHICLCVPDIYLIKIKEIIEKI